MAILPSTLLGILPVGCLLSMRGALSAETFLSVIVLSFGVMQPLITAFSHTDDIAQAGLQYGKDQYDRERYAELRQIAAAADRMIAVHCCSRDIFLPVSAWYMHLISEVSTRGDLFCRRRILGHENNGRSATRRLVGCALRLTCLYFGKA